MNLLIKYILTAFLVVVISELAKLNDRLGALLASLPIVTVLVLCWLYFEKQPDEKIANHAYYTFWYALGTLPFFLIFPWLLERFYFSGALILSLLLTLVIFYVYLLILSKFGIVLL